jgi:hypothetical protein
MPPSSRCSNRPWSGGGRGGWGTACCLSGRRHSCWAYKHAAQASVCCTREHTCLRCVLVSSAVTWTSGTGCVPLALPVSSCVRVPLALPVSSCVRVPLALPACVRPTGFASAKVADREWAVRHRRVPLAWLGVSMLHWLRQCVCVPLALPVLKLADRSERKRGRVSFSLMTGGWAGRCAVVLGNIARRRPAAGERERCQGKGVRNRY